VGTVNAEGKDDIYINTGPTTIQRLFWSVLKRNSYRNIYLCLQVRFPDSWERYKEDWLVQCWLEQRQFIMVNHCSNILMPKIDQKLTHHARSVLKMK